MIQRGIKLPYDVFHRRYEDKSFQQDEQGGAGAGRRTTTATTRTRTAGNKTLGDSFFVTNQLTKMEDASRKYNAYLDP
jgi:hypothetical protein